jgi:hypothetical protein
VLIRVAGMADGEDGDLFHVRIAVEDTGIGIAADKLDHVFGKFNQVEEERNRSFEGTGLGLAISRELVDVMGGDIWVESERDRGSCFTLSLPLRLAPGAQREAPRDPPAGLRRALVIEEASAARAILLKQLAVLGLDTQTLDPAAPPAGAGPCDVAFVADNRNSAATAAWVAALQQAGVRRIFSVNRARGGAARIHRGIEAAVTHPIRRNELARLLYRDGAQAEAPAPPAATAAGQRRRLRLLAAEDNRTNRLVFERLLADQEVEITFAVTGAEAVEAFAAADPPPDAVFMDISMPVMDGKEATRRIRDLEAQRGLPRTPVVAMTAHALTGDSEDILAAGLDDYLTKPMRKAEVTARLDAIRDGRFRPQATPAPRATG